MTTEKPKKRPAPPAGLGPAGKELWRHLVAEVDYDHHEVPIVLAACHQADDVALLEKLLASEGPTVIGSMGQPRLSPVLSELRQGRLGLAKLVAQLAIPASDDARPMTPAQQRGARAAEARWAPIRGHRGQAS